MIGELLNWLEIKNLNCSRIFSVWIIYSQLSMFGEIFGNLPILSGIVRIYQ